jgi:hypothetical protein
LNGKQSLFAPFGVSCTILAHQKSLTTSERKNEMNLAESQMQANFRESSSTQQTNAGNAEHQTNAGNARQIMSWYFLIPLSYRKMLKQK